MTATGDRMTGNEQELRLALGMRGGVSLAVWIGGACREVEAMRASARDGAGEAFAAPLEAPFWRRLLHVAGIETVTVDVLAGASAGGLNGVIYAASRMYGFSMDELRDVWLEIGGLQAMVRPGTAGSQVDAYFPSLLQGDEYFFRQLQAQLTRMIDEAKSVAGGTAIASSDRARLDLSLTTTLVEPIGRGDARTLANVPIEPRFASTFRFRRRGGSWLDDFGTDAESQKEAIARLALAGRATSSYPVAFEAARVHAPRPASFAEGAVPSSGLDVNMAGVFGDAGVEPFIAMDGGVLDNIPLGRAIDAIVDAPADKPTRRVLVYVCPGEPATPPRGSTESSADDRRTTWAVAQGLVRSRIRPETIAGDLQQLDDYHRRVARGRRLRRLAFADASGRAATITCANTALGSYLRSRADVDAQAIRGLLDDPVTVLGEDPFPAANWPDQVWRNPLTRWSDDVNRLDVALADALMIDSRNLVDVFDASVAPVGRVARLLIELARFVEAEAATDADRATAGTAKLELYRVLLVHAELAHRMQQVAWVVRAAVAKDQADWAVASRDHITRLSNLSAGAAADVRAYIASGDESRLVDLRLDRLGQLDRLLAGQGLSADGPDALGDVLLTVLLAHARTLSAIGLDRPAGTAGGDGPRPALDGGRLLHRALQPDGDAELGAHHLAALEVLTFPELAVGAPGGGTIEFEILSSINPTPLAGAFPRLLGRESDGDRAWSTIAARLVPRIPQVTVQNKLAGNELQNFAAFLRREWRTNDWMWGRLDAVFTLVRVVLTPEALVAAAQRHRDAGSAPVEGLLEELRLAVTRFDGAVAEDDLAAWEAFVTDTAWTPVEAELRAVCEAAVARAADPTLPLPNVAELQLCFMASRQWQILADELARQQNDARQPPGPATAPLAPRAVVEHADGYRVGTETLTDPPVAEDRALLDRVIATGGDALAFNLRGRVPRGVIGAVQEVVATLRWAWWGSRRSFTLVSVGVAVVAVALLLLPGLPAFDAGLSEPALYWSLAAIPGAAALVAAVALGVLRLWRAAAVLGVGGLCMVAAAGFLGENWNGTVAVLAVAAVIAALALRVLGRFRPGRATAPDESGTAAPSQGST